MHVLCSENYILYGVHASRCSQAINAGLFVEPAKGDYTDGLDLRNRIIDSGSTDRFEP